MEDIPFCMSKSDPIQPARDEKLTFVRNTTWQRVASSILGGNVLEG
jgi:hypothetical protein